MLQGVTSVVLFLFLVLVLHPYLSLLPPSPTGLIFCFFLFSSFSLFSRFLCVFVVFLPYLLVFPPPPLPLLFILPPPCPLFLIRVYFFFLSSSCLSSSLFCLSHLPSLSPLHHSSSFSSFFPRPPYSGFPSSSFTYSFIVLSPCPSLRFFLLFIILPVPLPRPPPLYYLFSFILLFVSLRHLLLLPQGHHTSCFEQSLVTLIMFKGKAWRVFINLTSPSVTSARHEEARELIFQVSA